MIRPKTIIPTLLLALLALETASILWAASPVLAAQHAAHSGLLFLLFIAPAWWLTQPAHRPQRQKIIQYILFLVGVIVLMNSTVGLLQFWRQDDLGLWWLGEIELAPVGGFSVVELTDRLTLRAYGLTRHPNSLGGLLMVGLLLLLPRVLLQRRPVAIAASILGFAALVVTFSRSSWLGLTLASVPLLWLWSTQQRDEPARLCRRTISVFGLSSLLLLAMMAGSNRRLIAARLSAESPAESRSLRERSVLIAHSFKMIKQAPLQGIGAGNFVFMLPDGLMDSPQPVHNMFLLISAEIGLPAGAVWLLITIVPLVISYRAWQVGKLTVNGCAITAALFACAITDQLDMYAWQWVTGRTLRWLLLALWLMTVSTELVTTKARRS